MATACAILYLFASAIPDEFFYIKYIRRRLPVQACIQLGSAIPYEFFYIKYYDGDCLCKLISNSIGPYHMNSSIVYANRVYIRRRLPVQACIEFGWQYQMNSSIVYL
jgi:hypothetical protein